MMDDYNRFSKLDMKLRYCHRRKLLLGPGTRWGLCPQTPVIGSCSALAMVLPTPSAAYDLVPRAPPLILTSLRLWLLQMDRATGYVSQILSTVETSCTTNPQQIEVTFPVAWH